MTATRTTSAGRRNRRSARVTRESDALDLEPAVFKKKNAKEIARSLKRSAEKSKRGKSSPLRSAMSMLTFYVNRAGENLPRARAKVLEGAKDELRRLYGRSPKTDAKGIAGRTARSAAGQKKTK